MLRDLAAAVTLAGVGWLAYRLETLMATAAEQIDALTAKVDDLAADVRVVVAERENLSPAGQAAVDRLNAKLTDLDTEVGDADGSDTPVEPEQPNA
jgi:hypothetical protein